MTRARGLALVMLAPVVIGSAFSWARLATASRHVPRDEDYRAISEAIRSQHIDPVVDALAVLPPWSLRPYQYLGDLPLITGDGLAARPLDRYRRLFVLAEPDAGRYLAPLVARLGRPASSIHIGRLDLNRFDLPAHALTFDFLARIEEATVRIVDMADHLVAPCDFRIVHGYACPGEPPWQTVNREWLLVTENGDQAVWAHPPPSGQRLQITFHEVRLGSRIVIRSGYTRTGADHGRVPIRMSVFVHDIEAGRFVRQPAFDFRPDVVDTRRWRAATDDVTFELESPGSNRYQHFAFDAYAAEP